MNKLQAFGMRRKMPTMNASLGDLTVDIPLGTVSATGQRAEVSGSAA
jgi:hypothetical protein